MREVSGALIAIGLVLTAVFIPTGFVAGIPGIFYRQFAVTIASAALISLLVSLTLSPALAAILLKPHQEHQGEGNRVTRPLRRAADKFNAGFDWLADRYGRFTSQLVRKTTVMLAIYGVLLAATGVTLTSTPTGFIPEQDQGALIGVVQLPPGSSLERTREVLGRAYEIVRKNHGVVDARDLRVPRRLELLAILQRRHDVHLLSDWAERGGEGLSQPSFPGADPGYGRRDFRKPTFS